MRAKAIALSLSLISSASHAEPKLIGSWNDAFNICRISIETANSINSDQLIEMGESTRIVEPFILKETGQILIPGYELLERRWRLPGSVFVVVESEMDAGKKYARKSCDLEFVSTMDSISAVEEELLVSEFKDLRRSLLDGGYHELRDPDPIFPTSLGFGPKVENSRGCRVISYLMINSRPGPEYYFSSGSAEQSHRGCPR